MSDIDWSKAPEGATHYGKEDDNWYASWHMTVNGVWFAMLEHGDDKWDECFEDMDDGDIARIASLIRRTEAWTGTGLPPVGINCEYMRRGGAEWFYCTVIAHHDGGAVVAVHEDDLSYSYWNDSGHFRPIRTPEQIEAEEREKAIDAMNKLVGDIEKIPTWRDALAALYDAGYRKTEAP